MLEILVERVRKVFSYLMGKRSEIRDMDVKDVMLAKVVLDIHRKRTHSAFVFVPLSELRPIHAIDRDNAVAATRKRAEYLYRVRELLLEKQRISRDVLAEYLPSISWIKVVRESETTVIAYEGNGRLAALQEVFAPADNILVEVEEYYFNKSDAIVRRMNRVRRLNGLI